MAEGMPPFAERLDLLKRRALLRLGALGTPSHFGGYSVERHADAYRAFGVEPGPQRGFFERPPSLEGATCPQCAAHLTIGRVFEDYGSRFAGTDAEGESYRFAAGELECPSGPGHLDGINVYSRRVCLDGTIADLLPEMERIADELGF